MGFLSDEAEWSSRQSFSVFSNESTRYLSKTPRLVIIPQQIELRFLVWSGRGSTDFKRGFLLCAPSTLKRISQIV